MTTLESYDVQSVLSDVHYLFRTLHICIRLKNNESVKLKEYYSTTKANL